MLIKKLISSISPVYRLQINTRSISFFPAAINKYFFISASIASLILATVLFLSLNTINPTANAIHSTDNLNIQRSFIIDPNNQLQLINMHQLSFSNNMNKDVPWTFSNQSYWLKYTLSNTTAIDKKLVMHLDNPMLDNLTIYQTDNQNQLIQQQALGWKSPSLSLLNKSINNFKFTVTAQQSNDLYIHINTQGIAKTPVTLYSPEHFQEYVRSVHLIWGAFIGTIFIIALYNLVIYYGLKETVYLSYILYLMSILSLMAIVQGFGHYLVPSSLFSLIRPNVIILNSFTLAFALLFAIFFLNIRNDKPLNRRCFCFFWLLIAFGIISLGLQENTSAPIFFILMAFTYLLCFWLLYKSYSSDQYWSRLYTFSWIPLLLGGAVQPLELTDVIPYTFLTRHLLLICILIEITLMAMALTERLRQQKERDDFNASHDLETGLPNYQALDKSLTHKLKNKWNFSLCLIEVAGFNRLSPYLSTHQSRLVLEKLLKGIASHTSAQTGFLMIEETLYPNQKIARVKENIFAIIVAESTDNKVITQQLIPLQQQMKGILRGVQSSIQLKTYIGYYRVNDDLQQASDIVKKTFQAIGTAVIKGQQINAFDRHQHLSLHIAKDLEMALCNDELELYHQPQIALNGNKVHGSEALLRWKHPSSGFIPPEKIINLAETIGLINKVTLWVIDKACQDIQSLVSQGYHQLRVSVNISPSDVGDEHFLDNLKAILKRHPIPMHLLSLELTESVMVNDYQRLHKVMDGLSQLGIGVSIDDYGTGYSSLTHLSQLPFNELKIDRIFIQSLDTNKRNLNIVKTTIDMAKVLNLRVVAEGIETQAVVDTLHSCGCEIVQGYFYAKPRQFSEYLQWLHSTKPISSS